MAKAEKVASLAVLVLAMLAATLIFGQNALNKSAQRTYAPPALTITSAQPAPSRSRRSFSLAPGRALIVPVAGIVVGDLADTWGQARSQGRTHEGIDIMAPSGAPVLAAVDGRVVKFFDSDRGGITIYEFDSAERYVYYYAHLSGRADGLVEGQEIRQGQVIGYVGSTGNASTPHLHFEIQRLGAERKWWVADSINPFPHLMGGQRPD
jgi:murein DD-endopeptidase MepM/ murein hydrolase activator NlpD